MGRPVSFTNPRDVRAIAQAFRDRERAMNRFFGSNDDRPMEFHVSGEVREQQVVIDFDRSVEYVHLTVKEAELLQVFLQEMVTTLREAGVATKEGQDG